MQSSSLGIRKTKLQPPRNQEHTIERLRVTGTLDRECLSQITLIAAPAGSGKSTAMVQAFHQLTQNGHAASWISLDSTDNDLTGLIALIVAATRGRLPNACLATSVLLENGLMPPDAILQRTFINELSELQQRITLFLDDYHCLIEPRVMALMNTIFEASIPSVRFFIATRNHQNIPVARLRVLGAVHELTFSDLQFDEAETRRLLHFWGHTDVTDNQSDLLRRKTEGWVAGLQLASIALANEADKGSFITALSGTNKRIDGFISDEVFQKHPASVQDFLLNTAILDRFTLDLCNVVNPTADNYRSLEYIEQWNLFLVPLDSEKKWFRYHHLFSDYLRRKLTDVHPGRVVELHRIAARWLFDHHLITEAIEHAFASGDHDLAGRLLDKGSDALFSAGRAMTLEACARRLPDAQIRRLPRLLLDRAWEHQLRWQFSEAKAALRDARDAVNNYTIPDGSTADGIDLSYLSQKLAHREMMLKLLRDDSIGARDAADAWIDARSSNDMFMYASALSAKILTDRELFRFDLVLSRAEEIRNMFMEHGALYGTVFHDSIVGRSLQRCGRLDDAISVLSRSLSIALKLHGERTPLASMPISLLASIAYERNELERARELLTGYLPLSKELGFVDNMMEAFLTSIRLAYLERDFAQVVTLLDEAECAAVQFGFDRFQGRVILERIRLAALDPFFARTFETIDLSCLPIDYDDPWALTAPSSRHETAALAQCGLLIAAARQAQAIPILKRWLRFAVHRHAQTAAVSIGVLLAHALIRNGDPDAAQRLLLDIMKNTGKSRFIRSFADQGPVLAPAFNNIRVASRNQNPSISVHAQSILDAIGIQGEDTSASPEAAIHGHLTDREIEILRLADGGLSNIEIANRMVLAESTIKWYWQRIFDKFASRGRRQAIRAARALGIIDTR